MATPELFLSRLDVLPLPNLPPKLNPKYEEADALESPRGWLNRECGKIATSIIVQTIENTIVTVGLEFREKDCLGWGSKTMVRPM